MSETISRIVEGQLSAISNQGVNTYRFEAPGDRKEEPFVLVMNTVEPLKPDFHMKNKTAKVAIQIEWTE